MELTQELIQSVRTEFPIQRHDNLIWITLDCDKKFAEGDLTIPILFGKLTASKNHVEVTIRLDDLCILTGITKSKSDFKRDVKNQAISMNGKKLLNADINKSITLIEDISNWLNTIPEDVSVSLDDKPECVILRRGKTQHAFVLHSSVPVSNT